MNTVGTLPDAKDPNACPRGYAGFLRTGKITNHVNLLTPCRRGGLEARAMEGSPSIAEVLTHIHYVRIVFVLEDTPEFTRRPAEEEWRPNETLIAIAQMLNEAPRLCETRKNGVEDRPGIETSTTHQIPCSSHMIWHEGYHPHRSEEDWPMGWRGLPRTESGSRRPVTWAYGMAQEVSNYGNSLLSALRRRDFDGAGPSRGKKNLLGRLRSVLQTH